MHREWQSLSALRSDSREWPSRIGVAGGVVERVGEVGDLDLDLAAADEGVVNGFGAGGGGGERIRMIWTWTSASVVVTGARASAVIPDHLCG